MNEFRILQYTDKALIEQENHASNPSISPSCWPSEASADLTNKTFYNVIGNCNRKTYFRMTGVQTNFKNDAVACWRFILGRSVEENLTELCKKALPNFWLGSGLKLFVKKVVLPLEVDIIVKDPITNRACIIECKSFYGYYTKKNLLGPNGGPKLEHVMQASLYLLEIKNGKQLKELAKECIKTKEEKPWIRNRFEYNQEVLDSISDGPVFTKIIYISRDEGDQVEFNIEVKQHIDGKHYPVINGVMNKTFCIESIYERYEKVQAYWFKARNEALNKLISNGYSLPEGIRLNLSKEEVLANIDRQDKESDDHKKYRKLLEQEILKLPSSFWPPADYEWGYSSDKITKMAGEGLIGKTRYNDYLKHKVKRIGDFQCQYCQYQEICVPTQNPMLVSMIYDLNNSNTDVEFE